jgi:hypothetical protein
MKSEEDNFQLPTRKLSAWGDLKIRWRLVKTKLGLILANLDWRIYAGVFTTLLLVAVFSLPLVKGKLESYVYHNPRIGSGDLWYDWKLELEDQRLASLTNSTDRSLYLLNLSRRRHNELLYLENQLDIDTTLALGAVFFEAAINFEQDNWPNAYLETAQKNAFIASRVNGDSNIDEAVSAYYLGFLADKQASLQLSILELENDDLKRVFKQRQNVAANKLTALNSKNTTYEVELVEYSWPIDQAEYSQFTEIINSEKSQADKSKDLESEKLPTDLPQEQKTPSKNPENSDIEMPPSSQQEVNEDTEATFLELMKTGESEQISGEVGRSEEQMLEQNFDAIDSTQATEME